MGWGETLLGAGLGAAGAIFSARMANRFAERMSNTAHQREVADLRRAGLNPMISANRGASSPQGVQADISGGAQRGASTALATQMQRAQIELTKSQADASTAQAAYTRNLSADLTTQGVSGRYQKVRSDSEQSRLAAEFLSSTMEQRKDALALALKKAEEEIRLTSSSAAQSDARTKLLELAKEGQINVADFEKRVGEAGPAMKFFIELVRLMSLSRGITP